MKYIKTFESYVGLFGLEQPDYLFAGHEDTLDDAYCKGKESYDNEYEILDNPYISLDPEEEKFLIGLYNAWEDGWKDASKGGFI